MIAAQHRRPVRIASASGAVTDFPENLADLAANNDVDFIVGDWMSEYNMTIRGSSKASRSNSGDLDPAYEYTFLESIEPALADITRKGIKLAVNAGGSDTKKLHDALAELVSSHSLKLNIAWVEGDEVYDAIQTCQSQGQKFRNITTGQYLHAWEFDPIYAQCYLGCWGIVEAFRNGADLVVCGRVADAAPTMAAAAYWHDWSRQSYHELAHSLVAGHFIECSFYVTGGNFSGFKSLPKGSSSLLSLPIATIQGDGTFFIGKEDREDRSGAVTVDTCRSQLLYELQGRRYYNSDVVAVLDQIKIEQADKNVVYVSNIGYEKPPPTTKVGVTAHGGYQAEVHYFLVGLDIKEKGDLLEKQLREYLDTTKFTTLEFTTSGVAASNPDSQDAATVDFRIFAQSRDIKALSPANFLKPCINIVMSTYPGATFAVDMRQGEPKPYNEYFVSIVPQTLINHVTHLPGLGIDVTIPAPTDTTPYRFEQDSDDPDDPTPLSTFGSTVAAPLGYVVHARSGDKSSDSNVGFYVRHADEYEWLRSLLTKQLMKTLLQNDYNGKRIERFELPNIHAVHFLLKDHLDRGVSASSTYDVLGKNVAEYLRAKHVQIPTKFLSRGRI